MRYDTYRIFYIPVNFVFNLPHYVTSYMHHTREKESKKGKKNMVTKNLLEGDSNPDPKNQLKLKPNAPTHWITSVKPDKLSLKEVYISSLWLLTVFKDDFFSFLISM